MSDQQSPFSQYPACPPAFPCADTAFPTPLASPMKDLFIELLDPNYHTPHQPYLSSPPDCSFSFDYHPHFLDDQENIPFLNLDDEPPVIKSVPPSYQEQNIKSASKSHHQSARRFRKSQEQLRILREQFKKDNGDWTKETIVRLSEETGLTENQIYKWGWDEQQKQLMSTAAKQDMTDYKKKNQGSRKKHASLNKQQHIVSKKLLF